MMHDVLVALAWNRAPAQHVVEKRTHFVGARRSAESDHQHRVAFCFRRHRVQRALISWTMSTSAIA